MGSSESPRRALGIELFSMNFETQSRCKPSTKFIFNVKFEKEELGFGSASPGPEKNSK